MISRREPANSGPAHMASCEGSPALSAAPAQAQALFALEIAVKDIEGSELGERTWRSPAQAPRPRRLKRFSRLK